VSPPKGPPLAGSATRSTEASPSGRGFWQRLFGRSGGRAAPPIGVPRAIGRYRVLRKIGEGGMGTVFEAEDEVLGRRIAIKRLKATDETGRRRFWREARAAARLSHPNVCQLFEVGEDAGGPFLAMELLSGEPLSERLQRGPLDLAGAVTLDPADRFASAEEMAEALREATSPPFARPRPSPRPEETERRAARSLPAGPRRSRGSRNASRPRSRAPAAWCSSPGSGARASPLSWARS